MLRMFLTYRYAIEAARAGEQGRGFAVVAGEVRKLAEESQRSSNQIGVLIREIQEDMIRSIRAMNQVKSDVESGLSVAEQTRINFQEIVELTNRVAGQIGDMAATAEQMSAGTQQVTSSFGDIASITQRTSGSTQEVAASAEEQLASMEEVNASSQNLSELALELRDAVSKFKV